MGSSAIVNQGWDEAKFYMYFESREMLVDAWRFQQNRSIGNMEVESVWSTECFCIMGSIEVVQSNN